MGALTMAGATLIGAGIAGATSGGQMILHGKSNKKTREWNERMYGIQRGHALEDWNRTNEYNSAQAQKERLKAAGMNPAMMYGQQGAGGVTAQEPRGADVKPWTPQIPDLQGMGLQMAAMMSQIKVNEATANKLNAEANKTKGVDTTEAEARITNLAALTENTEAKTALTRIERDLAEIEKEIADNTFNDVINTVLWESRKIEREVELLNNQKKISDATVSTAIKQIKTNLAVSLAQKAAIEAGTTLTEAETRATITRIYQGWEDLRIKSGTLSESERKGAWDRFVNDTQESFKISMDAANKILQAMGLRELLKGGHTPIQGFQKRY